MPAGCGGFVSPGPDIHTVNGLHSPWAPESQATARPPTPYRKLSAFAGAPWGIPGSAESAPVRRSTSCWVLPLATTRPPSLENPTKRRRSSLAAASWPVPASTVNTPRASAATTCLPDYAALSALYASRLPGVPLYQLYHYVYQDWFYTTNPSQRDAAIQLGYWNYGAAARVAATPEGNTAAFSRFYKGPPQTDHFYTTFADETNTVMSAGWEYEGTEGYLFVSQSEGTIPLFRYSHWDAANSDLMHYYTVDLAMHSILLNNGWIYDRVAGYVYAP